VGLCKITWTGNACCSLVPLSKQVSDLSRRNADFSSNWITSGLPTTRTSALTLYAS